LISDLPDEEPDQEETQKRLSDFHLYYLCRLLHGPWQQMYNLTIIFNCQSTNT